MDVRRVLAGVTVGLFVLGMSIPALGASTAKSDSTIGMVDVQKLISEYKKKQTADDAVKSLAKNLSDKLALRGSNRLLSDAEVAELSNLRDKTKPTEKEMARITELQNLEKSRENELQELQNKSNPSAADKARLLELQGQIKHSTDNLTKLKTEYTAQIQKESTERGKAITDDILQAVKKVAEQKGIPTVVDKQAVLYGGIDITTSVLDMLNKK